MSSRIAVLAVVVASSAGIDGSAAWAGSPHLVPSATTVTTNVGLPAGWGLQSDPSFCGLDGVDNAQSHDIAGPTGEPGSLDVTVGATDYAILEYTLPNADAPDLTGLTLDAYQYPVPTDDVPMLTTAEFSLGSGSQYYQLRSDGLPAGASWQAST